MAQFRSSNGNVCPSERSPQRSPKRSRVLGALSALSALSALLDSVDSEFDDFGDFGDFGLSEFRLSAELLDAVDPAGRSAASGLAPEVQTCQAEGLHQENPMCC